MKISVLLANYNHGRYLAGNIDAIRKQSHQDWEIVLVDDGSTDDSSQIIASHAAADRRIRPIMLRENRGAVAAYQRALAEASGDCVYGSAADDYVCRDTFFAQAVHALKRHPRAAGMFARSRIVDTTTGDTLWVMGEAPRTGYLSPIFFAENFFSARVFVPGCAAIWRRDLVNEIGGFDASLGPQTDYLINHGLPMMHGVVFSSETVSVTRYHESSYGASADDASFFRRHAMVERRLRGLDLPFELQPRWVARWRERVLDGRLAITRQRQFVRAIRLQVGSVQPWEVNSLPERFNACRQRLLDECALLETELAVRVGEGERIFDEVSGPLPAAQAKGAPPWRRWTRLFPSPVLGFARRVRRAVRAFASAEHRD